jgi:hypothetical protein
MLINDLPISLLSCVKDHVPSEFMDTPRPHNVEAWVISMGPPMLEDARFEQAVLKVG